MLATYFAHNRSHPSYLVESILANAPTRELNIYSRILSSRALIWFFDLLQ